MKSKILALLVLTWGLHALAGGIHFRDEYRGESMGEELVMKVTPHGSEHEVTLELARRIRVSGKMRVRHMNGGLESVFELLPDSGAFKYTVVTPPPCVDVQALKLILPSGAEVGMEAVN